ncbi:glycosyltransferase family 4 protein [Nostoc spongiaeforme FACHB-130]|uniref:Glycosyltransferase family 4 protein n=1 Tax=Nostoc spongiaeforme FACHB-130 TaxID=1357510 RepID=A0ABR8FYY7_9NOSO|nr:glycosyltransferase family 4 protein [Nostoc spongiaeforme]MBD2596469.1 glycosyltransferase family 4 protein [Nostoc spongiaeforme FACHB-130]
MKKHKLAIITSHPIQYYAPWFRHLYNEGDLQIKVFYLWDFGVTKKLDQDFQQVVQWDIPLLDGYEHEFVPNVSSQPGVHHFWGLKNPSLISQVQAYNPDGVLLMNYNYASIYNFLWNWKSRKIPLLFRGDSHRLLQPTGIKAWARQQFITQIYRCFAACLYVGKANYEYFRYHGVPSNHLFFSPHAIDNDRFFAQADDAKQQASLWKQELGIPSDHAVIVFAGKFEAKKRPLDLLQAFVSANLSQVSLLFVGAGSLEADLKAAAAPHSNIYFAPFQNQTLMPRTYAIADLFVLPSYGAWETWGLAINEAMCLSRAVLVSSHVGCAKDLVYNGQNGLVFPAGDVSALTKSLQEAFCDRQRLQLWGEESQKIVSRYSYTQTSQGLKQAIDYLCR